MEALVVLCEGCTEYEYQLPILALLPVGIPFDAVGLRAPLFSAGTGSLETTEQSPSFPPGLRSCRPTGRRMPIRPTPESTEPTEDVRLVVNHSPTRLRLQGEASQQLDKLNDRNRQH